MSKSLNRTAAAFLLAFFLLALALGRWSIASPDLVARDDNPRRVFQEQLIQRGSIFDRNNQVLAETVPQSDTLARRYPFSAAAPVVGYYSINYGAAGVEEALDQVLRGPRDEVDQLLHHRQSGQSVRTTLDSRAQQILSDRLTQPGAAVVLSLPEGAVTALASNPSFDPNTLDQNWKTLSADPAGPLLNRATQGLYQPGAIFETLILADAIEHGIPLTETLSNPDRSITVDRATVTCAHDDASPTTLAEAYTQACPAPFADLAAHLTASDLISLTQQWKLDVPPSLEIRTSAALTPTVDLSTTQALQAYALGQGELTVSPLRMAEVAATIGNNGFMPSIYLVKDVQSPDGTWQPYANSAQAPVPIIDPAVARAVLQAMRVQGNSAGHGGAAISGDRKHAWFIGLAPADQPRYAIAVLLEDAKNATDAEDIGRAVLEELSNTP
ncbi:MAG TPA: penicillin-binding transpeptidase domain-containing protein [Anaerolineae bacterium]|nr:penicillin-binding transpeptidase domain-containing protein [Anaerolineae bacterium]